nr:YCF48-related protein [uncultured Duganella sp.]
MTTSTHVLAALLLAALAPAAALAQAPAPATPPPSSGPAVPDALTRPAVIAPKAGTAAMLAVARAGKRLVAVGERGIVLLSDDQGGSWRQVATPVQVSLTAVRFANERAGWAVGHLGVVLHTADGGQTWRKQLDGIEAAELALRAATTPREKAAAEHLRADGPDKPFLDLYFQDANTGFILGAYNLLLRTADGGKTWTPWQGRVPNPKSLHLYGMGAAGGALYLVGEQGSLFRSLDGGDSFEALASPYKGSYFGLVTARGGEVVVFGLRGTAYWSGDKGDSWRPVDTGTQQTLSAGIELGDGRLALLSQGGDVLLSADGGRSFARQANPQPSPAAALVQADDRHLVVAGLRGLKRQTLTATD